MHLICGIDEAGRGPIAGPVTAAAVILTDDFPHELLRDSKQLSPKQRSLLEPLIREKSFAYAVSWCSPREIDRINILQASLKAMKRAFDTMMMNISAEQFTLTVFVDGNQFPPIDAHMFAVVKGDRCVPEIMAASILAKEARDRWMRRCAQRYPQWQFDRHKGYPTPLHRELCSRYGLSPVHRKSFRISS